MNRSTLAFLGLALTLAAGACGRYGPPIRPIDAGAPAPAAAPAASDRPAGANPIETFEDESTP